MPPYLLKQSSVDSSLPGVEFAHPAWLLLIPPLCLFSWWIARRALGGWHGGKQTAALAIRCLVIALLAAALAEPSIRWSSQDVSVVVIRDVSNSIPQDQQRLTDRFLAESAKRMKPADRLAVVTAARDAFVQSLPSPGQPRLDTGYTGPTDATNLQSGAQLAMAIAAPDAGSRLLLISDGHETAGSFAPVIAAAKAANIPIDVASVAYDRSRMVRVREVIVPPWARENDIINARIVIDSGRTVSGMLSVSLNGTLVDTDPDTEGLSQRVELAPGLNAFTVPLKLSEASVHHIEAFFEPDRARANPNAPGEEAEPAELLRATGVTFTSSRGRILVLTDDEEGHRPFLDAVRSDELIIEVRPSSNTPVSLPELAGYDAIVLANQPASNFSMAQQEQLVRYIHDTGGGLLMLGGPESFGAGGWIGSPLADALPVLLDPPQKRQMPMGALALIIDRSGSMGAPVGGTGLNQQQVANEAAVLGIRALSRLDQVAVIAFSGETEVVLPLTTCDDPEGIARKIRGIGPGGGTILFPAIDAAAAELAKSQAGIKHIIILTDGQTMGDPPEGIAKAAVLRRKSITISTVAIGDVANDDLLKRIAQVGGGRSYGVRSDQSLAVLPQIFIKEAQTVRRALIWEGPPFAPRIGSASESLRGISGALPAINGYVVTADRPGLITVPIRGPENDPILAQWQHGLGRVTAYTSDASTRWNAHWTGWGSYAAFWKQQLQWTMRPTGDPRARIVVDPSGDKARVVLELFDDQGERVNFAQVKARIVRPSSTSWSGGEAEDLTLRQVGPGRYEGDAIAADPGVHVVSLRYEAPVPAKDGSGIGRQQGSVRAAVVKRAGDELREPTPDTEGLWEIARRTNGRIHTLGPDGVDLWNREHVRMPVFKRAIWLGVLLAGLALFLVDVAVRRVAIDLPRIKAWALGLFIAAPLKKPESMQSLSAAKARAAAAIKAESKRPAPDGDPRPVPASPLTFEPQPPAPVVESPPPKAPAAETPKDTMSRLHAAKKRSQQD